MEIRSRTEKSSQQVFFSLERLGSPGHHRTRIKLLIFIGLFLTLLITASASSTSSSSSIISSTYATIHPTHYKYNNNSNTNTASNSNQTVPPAILIGRENKVIKSNINLIEIRDNFIDNNKYQSDSEPIKENVSKIINSKIGNSETEFNEAGNKKKLQTKTETSGPESLLGFLGDETSNQNQESLFQGDFPGEDDNSIGLREHRRREIVNRIKSNLIESGINFQTNNKCDRLFLSSSNGPHKNGTFESPILVVEEGHSLQCIYAFIPQKNERVEVSFTQFNVRGINPECVHEWVDIYTEIEDPDVSDLISAPFGGRYCGRIPPRRRISLFGGIALGFYTDKNETDDYIFQGTYTFFSGDRYVVGTPIPRTQCSYTILAKEKRSGNLTSPTYPGVYPKDLSCSYKFEGLPGQRIRLEFRDFDLFYGGAHCPFDDVHIYDGLEVTSPLIGTYCGQQRNLVVYSSEHLLLVTFTTLERNTVAQNRGFNAVFEFSESFVKLGKNAGEHIRGTECDQRILSKGRSSGPVYSPNYPYPYLPKIVCRYFIYGLQDHQQLERVRFSFEKFDVQTNINSEEDSNHSDGVAKCGDGFLKLYLKGQEVIQAYDKADYEFCGKEIPEEVISDGPRLVLVFSSGETQGSGFKAKYQFETEYRIPGTPAPTDDPRYGTCTFSYYSSSRKNGDFNSPRFPSNYPSETNCTYTFVTQPNEQVRVVFDHFKVRADKFNGSGGAYGNMCFEDFVEIFNVFEFKEDKLFGRYCGSTAPGPIESREGAQKLKIVLQTDKENVFSGFKARYIFFTAKSIFGDCGGNISSGRSGMLTSPRYPLNYDGPQKGTGSSTCNWYISARPGYKIMLHFQVFAVEGEPNTRGCPAAAVRIWEDPDAIPVELCGEALPLENSQYVSVDNLLRITFITADKAVGARGFKAVWTEVYDGSSSTCPDNYFRCSKTDFCIENVLRCDGEKNCGLSSEVDSSDEDGCGLETEINLIMIVILGGASGVLLLIIFCIWGQRKKRKRQRRLQLRRPPIHVCDNAGARFAAAMDSV